MYFSFAVRASLASLFFLSLSLPAFALDYPIAGTGQNKCYNLTAEMPAPLPGQPFYGQDAQHPGKAPAYRDNGDGTVSDLNTGLMWVKARGVKVPWRQALEDASKCRVGGYTDWRAPSIKELYSLINFNGGFFKSAAQSVPYLDTRVFEFVYGDEARGERGIDCQDWSTTEYLASKRQVFGVNFADGRIKGYPKMERGNAALEHKMYIRYVRGNPAYGKNQFRDNGDGTITDAATGLMWPKADSGKGMEWGDALAWVQARNKENFLGHNDWRLPNAKELQSIVDYSRSPDITHSAAISPVFDCTSILNEGGKQDFPFFWSGTTHLDGRHTETAVYVTFGRALGFMQHPGMGLPWQNGPGMGTGAGNGTPPQPGGMAPQPAGTPPQPGAMARRPMQGQRGMPPRQNPPAEGSAAGDSSASYQLVDVHGAGAQRSDPKSGNPANFPHGRGPQGDVIRIKNFVRCVRDAGGGQAARDVSKP